MGADYDYMNLRDFQNASQRREALEKNLDLHLPYIGSSLIDDPDKIHCENLVGAITVPLGVAGPLKLHGSHIDGEFYVPLATTEGALIASVSRGCKAINESGGAAVYAYRVGATRGPVFAVDSLRQQKSLYQWIKNNQDKIAQAAASTSRHLQYKKAMVKGLARYVFARFSFDTDNAMGMNMVTIATQKIVELIEKETGIPCLAVAGNFDVDKKPAWLNFVENRGTKAWAEVVMSSEIIKEVLKTKPAKLFDVWLGKCIFGSAMSGSLGFNAHFANIIAALYAATGQDLAHVAEGSMGITTMKLLPNNHLHCSVYLPALMLGVVGGGTSLKTQSEARSITKVTAAVALAEVLAGAILAGEISLLAALAEGSLAKAHEKLGR